MLKPNAVSFVGFEQVVDGLRTNCSSQANGQQHENQYFFAHGCLIILPL
jgi:hypothetical protein